MLPKLYAVAWSLTSSRIGFIVRNNMVFLWKAGIDMVWSLLKKKSPNPLKSKETLNAFFGKGTQLEGVLSFQGTLRIDGNFKGEIAKGGTLIIGEEGVIESNVYVSDIIIGGEFKGNIIADEMVDINASGKVIGDVQAPGIIIQAGAILKGKLRIHQRDEIFASVIPFDPASQKKGVVTLKFGEDRTGMREMRTEDVLMSRLRLLIVMCAAYLKGYPAEDHRKEAIRTNANNVAKGYADLNVSLAGVQGDEVSKGGMDFEYVFRQRVRLLALMAKGFVEGNPIGQFREKALVENIDFISKAIDFDGKIINMDFLKLA